MNIGIYAIKNTVNGKHYVGQSVNLKSRKYEHFRLLNANKHHNVHLQAAYNKYGKENFKFEIIESYKDIDYINKQFLTEREIFYIEKLNCINEGYNQAPPNKEQTSFTIADEYKKSIWVWSKEDKNLVGSYDSIREACGKLDLNCKKVYDILAPNSKTKARSHKGYLFTLDGNPPRKDKKRGVKPKPITIDGVTYDSIKVAAESFGIKPDTLRHRLFRSVPKTPKYRLIKDDNIIFLNHVVDAIHYIDNATQKGIQKLRNGRYQTYYGWKLEKT